MALTRSTKWTKSNGDQIAVKKMSIGELHQALQDICHMEISHDAYVVACVCELLNITPPPPALENRDEWLNLLTSELNRRNKLLNLTEKTRSLVNLVKFW